MKKIFFIGLAAVAVLASCSKDETVEGYFIRQFRESQHKRRS